MTSFSPDFIVASVELENSTLVRLTSNIYVGYHGKQSGAGVHNIRGTGPTADDSLELYPAATDGLDEIEIERRKPCHS
jgi:hypothetical protein